MATITALPVLLDSLAHSLSSVLEATSKVLPIEAPEGGVSLLDVKNELLLAYLEHLTFLVLVKLRRLILHRRHGEDQEESGLENKVVKKLVELRLYMERGVRPLEEKLRYQIEKVLKTALDAERNQKASTSENQSGSVSGSDDEQSDDEDAESHDEKTRAASVAVLQARPNLGALSRPATTKPAGVSEKGAHGVYRPPKIVPTVMPTTERGEKRERGPIRSKIMDEFVAEELSAAPTAQPSIGTNIAHFGRRLKTSSDRKEEDERREYEERNFVRLPRESKKDRAKKAVREGRSSRMKYGGEEWMEIGMGADRIDRLTTRKEGVRGTKALLEKSRKRVAETVDGPRGGENMGERYQKRLKALQSGPRDRGKKK